MKAHAHRRALLALWGLVFVIVPTILAPLPAWGQQDGAPQFTTLRKIPYTQVNPHWKDCGLRAYNMPGRTEQSIGPYQRRDPSANRAQTAEIIVDYGSGFTREAQTAFQRAIDIWEQHITSPVPIRIDASFEPLGSGILGGTRPQFVYSVDLNGDGSEDTILTDAIYDAVSGQDQSPGEFDILITFNREFEDWNFDLDSTPDDKIDFTGVVLHEIAHGLSYFHLFGFDRGAGGYGVDFSGNGQLEESEKLPGIFGAFVVEEQTGGSLVPITDTSLFPNPSEALGEALTRDRLFFDGESASNGAATSTGPIPPKLYAPFSWEPGSSIAHTDEDTYGPGDPNSLMTPFVGRGETERTPGPVVCGQLEDMGWTLGAECQRFFENVFAIEGAATASPTEASFTLTWQALDDAGIQSYFVEQSTFGGPFETVQTLSAGTTSTTLSGLGLGEFAFRLGWVNADGTSVRSETFTATYNIQEVNTEIVSRTDLGRGTVDVSWIVPPGTEGFTYALRQAAGTGEELQTIEESLTATEVSIPNQPPGRYSFQVAATDAEGNTLESETQSVSLDFDGEVFILGPYPNPTRGDATVELTARNRQTVQVEVFNSIGQRVLSENRSLSALAPVTLDIDGDRWASGMYFIRVTGSDFTETQQFVVL
jgi:hypothetical protein